MQDKKYTMSQNKDREINLNFSEENELFRTTIATMEKNGKRKWMYVKKAKGKFTNYRTLVSSLFLILFLILPVIHLPNGNPLFKFDVFNTEFILFGFPFFTSDFFLLAFGMILAVVFIILFTSAYGRIFCGWMCPQTIFLEFIFRKIEFWIEGDRNKQIRLDKQEWDQEKIVKKGLKWTIFYAISVVVVCVGMMYIVGSDFFLQMLREGFSEHYGKFSVMFIVSWLFFFVFAWFREQVCTLVCPFGRLQSVLLDKQSLQVAYDFKRGENTKGRSKFRKNEDRKAAGKGDCIDCSQCVAVCPTGIDIRNGSQLECVNCTACMDACDEVMEKINFPRGLVKITSEDNLKEGKSFRFTGRMIAFTSVVVIMITGMIAFLWQRSDVEGKFLQIPGKQYTEEGVYVTNTLQYTLMNKTNSDFDLTVKVGSHQHTVIEVISSQNPFIHIANGELEQGFVKVKIPKSEIQSYKEPIVLQLYDKDDHLVDEFKMSFRAPYDIGLK